MHDDVPTDEELRRIWRAGTFLLGLLLACVCVIVAHLAWVRVVGPVLPDVPGCSVPAVAIGAALLLSPLVLGRSWRRR